MATLQERIKEEIVLRRGHVKERQWRQTGLLDEAARDGISADDFWRLVNEVSRQINFEKLADLRRRLEEALDLPPRYQLHQLQQDDFVAEAERLGLPADFVESRWLPRIIADLKAKHPEADASTEGEAQPVAPKGPAEIPKASAATPLTTEAIRHQVKEILDEYPGYISARELRMLFKAMKTDEQLLAEEIRTYFTTNFYGAVSETKGHTLPEVLLSTDWRHMAWWDKAPVAKPAAAPQPLTDAGSPEAEARLENKPSVLPPPALKPPSPAPAGPVPQPPRSNAGLWGAVFAVVVLLILYLLIRPNQKKADRQSTGERIDQTEQPTEPRPSKRKKSAKKAPDERVVSSSRDKEPARSEPRADEAPKPATKYDRLLETTGQFGEHPAKLGRKWGLWRDGDWMIFPIYDDITTFRDDRATVVRNGRTYDIDPKGNPLTE